MTDDTRRQLSRRTLLQGSAGALGAAALTGGLTRSGPAWAEDSPLKDKNLSYIAFGLQYEYQVTLVNHIKEVCAAKGCNVSVYDGKGDPSTQTTQLLDIVSKQPDLILLNAVDAKLLVGGVKKANKSDIPLFMLENLPPEGDWVAYNTFDDKAGGAAGADAMAKLIGDKGPRARMPGRDRIGAVEPSLPGFPRAGGSQVSGHEDRCSEVRVDGR